MFPKVIIILLLSKCILAYTSSICAQVPDGHFVRSSQSCNSYNRCDNGQPTHGTCPKGFSFHPSGQTCSHNIDVDCQKCSPYGIQNIPHPDDCSMYYRCTNGIRTTMKCSNQLLFDRHFGDCNLAQRVICEPKNTICEPFRHLDWLGTIKIGNPLDCSSFYYCINGNAIESICPSGLSYNPYTATCEDKDTVKYCQGLGPIITTPLPEITTREYTTPSTKATTTIRVIRVTNPTATTTDASTTTEPTTTTESSTTTATTTTPTATSTTTTETTPETPSTEETTLEPEPSTPDTIQYPNCPARTTGYFPMPYPDNCTRYYYCSNGIQRFAPMTCTPGLFFTPGNDRCTANVPPGCEHLAV
ncbi:hypothetical protein HA402_006837 [Bradysia odoriphaga]|nr:hypothetical protein HA402_006837 [Bradysia odoriphaga]